MTTELNQILILDPDLIRGELLRQQVAGLGFPVSAATTMEAALEAASTRTFSLSVVDTALPVEALADFRQNPRLRGVPILLIAENESDIDERLPYIVDCMRRPFGSTLLQLRLNALLKHARFESELRVERDLQIARDIQLGFLPQELPSLPGWEIATRFDPAYEVAGDFYDVFFLTNKTRVGFIVADVCDKGIGSALFMGLSRSLLRAFAQQNYTVNWADVLGGKGNREARAGKTRVGVTALSNALTLTNNYIAINHGQSNMFATLFFGILNPETGLVSYVNAGHNPPLIISPDKQVKGRLPNTSMPIGMFPDVEFKIEVAQLDPGDMLLAFTDGVTEAKNVDDELYTDERLEMLMTAAPDSAEALLAFVQADVKLHVGNAPQSDDITMLALRRAPLPISE